MAIAKTIKQRNKELEPFGKQIKSYGLILRLYPNEKQINQISRTFGCSRLVYNTYLSERKEYYTYTGKTYSVGEFKKYVLTPAKSIEDYSFLGEVDKYALEVACENVEDAFNRFYSKQNKFPKFKSKKKSKKSYTTRFTDTPAGGTIRILSKNTLQLPKLGSVVMAELKCKKNKSKLFKVTNGDAKIKKATVSQKGDKFYVSLCLEEIVDIIKPIKRSEINLNKVCGIDLGLKTFATINNGESITFKEKEKYFSVSEKKLAKIQRRISKKKIGSSNHRKASYKVAKLHNKIANQRKDFNHKLSTEIANENQVVILETLNIKGMVKNKNLSKAISDAGWYQFITFLKYKLEWQGKILIQVDKWFASSKLCSNCGEKKIALTLSEREWACSSCGQTHDRDGNASVNIRNEGLRLLNIAV